MSSPPPEPRATGLLDTGDGHRVYWESCGNPDGVPALFLHGGPGTGASPGSRRLFEPATFRSVLFDQRGSGRSTPLAGEPDADLSTNTTAHLIADIERLREHLGIERWIVLGVSWGSTLALAYAQTHPARVSGIVLGAVTTTSRREIDWITEGVGRIFPREWERFANAVPRSLRALRIVDAYGEMLTCPDARMREEAAREWCAWEDAHVSLTPGYQPYERFEDPTFRLGFARLVTHYWRNLAFLEDEQLLNNAPMLDGIPGVLVHGVRDVSGPLETAWRLSKRWRTSRLVALDDAGHGGGGFQAAITDGLRELATHVHS